MNKIEKIIEQGDGWIDETLNLAGEKSNLLRDIILVAYYVFIVGILCIAITLFSGIIVLVGNNFLLSIAITLWVSGGGFMVLAATRIILEKSKSKSTFQPINNGQQMEIGGNPKPKKKGKGLTILLIILCALIPVCAVIGTIIFNQRYMISF